MTKSVKKKKIKLLEKNKGFVLFFLLIILLLIISPVVTTLIGDKFLEADQINKADYLYQLSHALNPFNQEILKRLSIVQVIKEERTIESEETALPKTAIAQETKLNSQKKVLGAYLRVPVLMYHYIRINPNYKDKIGFNLSVTPSDFAAQMNYLDQQGYYPMTLDDLNYVLYHPSYLPKKPIVITFDDGYEDSYTNAFPILKSHHFRAINFVITGFVGEPNYLTWNQITEMKDSGIFFFEGHTVHHYALTNYNSSIVRYELSQSKLDLQNHLNSPVNWMAYPYGNVNWRVVALVKQAHYIGAFGTNFGTYQSTNYMYTLPRVRVSGGETLYQFAQNLPW